jgi:hypothetical protein
LIVVDGTLWGRCAQPRLVRRQAREGTHDVFVMLTPAPLRRFGAPLGLPDEDAVSSLIDPAPSAAGYRSRRVDDIRLADLSPFEFDVLGETLSRTATWVVAVCEPGMGDALAHEVDCILEIRTALADYRSEVGSLGLERALRRFSETEFGGVPGGDIERLRSACEALLPATPNGLAGPGV